MQSRIDTATEDLKNMVIDEDDVAHILEVMLHERRIGPDELAAFLKTPEGELYSTIAELQAHAEVVEEVLTAAVDGKLFSELSDDARLLLLGGDDVEDWAGLSQTKRDQIARNRANRDEALLAVQEATDYIYMLTQALGDLETRRNALGGILKQMRNQRPEMPATTSQRLEKLARDLDESRQMITDLVGEHQEGVFDNGCDGDCWVGVEAVGRACCGGSGSGRVAATARQMGKTAEGLRDLRQMMSFIPEDGQFVRFVRNGRTRSWEIRVRTQPLKDRLVRLARIRWRRSLAKSGLRGCGRSLRLWTTALRRWRRSRFLRTTSTLRCCRNGLACWFLAATYWLRWILRWATLWRFVRWSPTMPITSIGMR